MGSPAPWTLPRIHTGAEIRDVPAKEGVGSLRLYPQPGPRLQSVGTHHLQCPKQAWVRIGSVEFDNVAELSRRSSVKVPPFS